MEPVYSTLCTKL